MVRVVLVAWASSRSGVRRRASRPLRRGRPPRRPHSPACWAHLRNLAGRTIVLAASGPVSTMKRPSPSRSGVTWASNPIGTTRCHPRTPTATARRGTAKRPRCGWPGRSAAAPNWTRRFPTGRRPPRRRRRWSEVRLTPVAGSRSSREARTEVAFQEDRVPPPSGRAAEAEMRAPRCPRRSSPGRGPSRRPGSSSHRPSHPRHGPAQRPTHPGRKGGAASVVRVRELPAAGRPAAIVGRLRLVAAGQHRGGLLPPP